MQILSEGGFMCLMNLKLKNMNIVRLKLQLIGLHEPAIQIVHVSVFVTLQLNSACITAINEDGNFTIRMLETTQAQAGIYFSHTQGWLL